MIGERYQWDTNPGLWTRLLLQQARLDDWTYLTLRLSGSSLLLTHCSLADHVLPFHSGRVLMGVVKIADRLRH